MYIQITTQCNMSCDHCCFSCSKHTPGEHMSKRTFNQALAFASEYGEFIGIGGGEPTIHPQFWEFFGLALGSEAEGIWMATNGKKTKIAIALANFAGAGDGRFSVALSQDPWHDPINARVVAAFTRNNLEFRDVSNSVSNVGAARENGVGIHDNQCVCSDLFINPQGDVFMCGCPGPASVWLGHVSAIEDDVIQRAHEVGEDYDECGRQVPLEDHKYIIDGGERPSLEMTA